MRKRLRYALTLVFLLAATALGTTVAMSRFDLVEPPRPAPNAVQADEIHVDKSESRMVLLRDGREIARYTISLGANPVGHKAHAGDERTPTGAYEIDWRNPNSIAYLSLHISYPNANDIAKAAGQASIRAETS